MAIGTEEPILPKLDRLDNMLRQLEEIRGSSRTSPKTSTASSPSSDGHPSSSMDSSPRSLEKLCRPLERVVMETEQKGTLLQRLEHVEDRLLKLCIQVEEEVAAERKREEEDNDDHSPEKPHKKGLIKGLVKKVISPKHHAKHKHNSMTTSHWH